jgi:two-component system sensor histidine kinase CpxA
MFELFYNMFGRLYNVFEPFYKVEHLRNRVTGNVGLGSSVARIDVHAHGGGIRLSKRRDGGQCINIDLPR